MPHGHLIAAFLALLLWWLWPIRLPKRKPRDALDEPVSVLGGQVLTGRTLAEGVIWVGGIGSGKTSTAAHLLVDMLRHGYSAVLYTVKIEEPGHLERLVARAGVSPDKIIRIGRAHPENTIDAVAYTYSATRSVESVAQLFEVMMNAVSGKGDVKGDQKSRFFENSGLIAVRHATVIIACIDPEKLSFKSIGAMISDAPTIRYINNPVTAEEKGHVAWFRQTDWWRSREIAEARLDAGEVPAELAQDLKNALAFFTGRWASLANDTRSSIVASVTAMSELFSFNPLRSLIAEKTRIVPELLWKDGQKVFLFTDAAHWGVDRKMLMIGWKFLIQKAAERRDTTKNKIRVVQWQDEAPVLAISAGRFDTSFLDIARSKHFVNIIMCQSLAQFHEVLGGEHEANNYLASLRMKVAMAVSEPWSQKALSELIGKEMKFFPAPQPAPKEGGIDWWGSTQPANFHSQMDYAIYPHEWGSLQKAKPGQLGEAILYLGGTKLPNGKTYVRVWLRQLLD